MTEVVDREASAEMRLTALYSEYAAALMGRLSGYAGGNRHTAEDLLQETMLRAWRGVGSLPADPVHARRWLFTIARNVAVDAVRLRGRRPVEISDTEAVAAVSTDDPVGTVIAVDTVRRAFRALNADQRTVVAELFLAGRSPAETAKRLGVPVGTVKSRAHYAVLSLRRSLGAQDLAA